MLAASMPAGSSKNGTRGIGVVFGVDCPPSPASKRPRNCQLPAFQALFRPGTALLTRWSRVRVPDGPPVIPGSYGVSCGSARAIGVDFGVDFDPDGDGGSVRGPASREPGLAQSCDPEADPVIATVPFLEFLDHILDSKPRIRPEELSRADRASLWRPSSP